MAKTLRSRIAAVAVAAVSVGLLQATPAFAGANEITMLFALNTTDATSYPTAGTAVVVPVDLTTSATSDASGAKSKVTATLTTKPTNSALDAEGATTASTTLNDASTSVGTVAATASTSSTGAILTYTQVHASDDLSGVVIGSFGFTPDVPGYYVMTITPAEVADATAGANTNITTTTAITVGINVTGAALVQGFSGLGATSGTQIAGRQAAAVFFPKAGSDTTSRYQVTASGVDIVGAFSVTAAGGTKTQAAVSAVSFTDTTNITKNDGTTFASGFTYAGQRTTTSVIASGSAYTDAFIVQVNKAIAGTGYVYIKSVNATTGALTTLATLTFTYVASGTSAISAAHSTIGLQTDACPSAGSNKAGDEAALANESPADSAAAAGGTLHVCIYTRDGNGTLIAADSGQITTTLGYIGTTATPTASSVAADPASAQDMYLLGVSTMVGTATVTAVIIDAAGYAITLSTPVTFWGSLATLALSNTSASLSTAPYSSYYAASTKALTLLAKDANGNAIDLSRSASGTGYYTVESTFKDGAAADRSSDSSGSTVSSNFGSEFLAYGIGNYVTVSCATAAAPEKLTITAWGTNALGGWVSSNTATYYCAGSASTVKVTPDKTAVDVNGTTTVQVEVLDANGYPAADGTGVTLTANNGAVLNTPSTSTLNGKFRYAATFSAASNGTSTITANTSGNKVGSATVKVGTGVDTAAAAAADAAKAAAAVAALSTTVANMQTAIASLVASVTATLTAMSAQINKIMKKLKIK